MTDNKEEKKLRQYPEGSAQHAFYRTLHARQSLAWVRAKKAEYSARERRRMTMAQALELLDTFVDPSDPDTHEPNVLHAYQTAERIRKEEPDNTALQVCGLVHDVGKVLFSFGEPSWAVVGDTFVLGCKPADSIVCRETLRNNPDAHEPWFTSETGIYDPGCGMAALHVSFGHDEYLYRVLAHNRARHALPERYWDVVRFHSLYPWHTGGDYAQFMRDGDERILRDVRAFNRYDLYSKQDDPQEITPETRAYYAGLLARYFPEPLAW